MDNLRTISARPARVLAVGEVLWDCFPGSRTLGGAPLNFAAHLTRLGNQAALLSAVGADHLGEEAAAQIYGMDLAGTFLQVDPDLPTGTAVVDLSDETSPHFTITRPAAYDGIALDVVEIAAWKPEWVYYGSLLGSRPEPNAMLHRLFGAVPAARRFCDVNLRPGCVSPELLPGLLGKAHVLKINEDEMATLSRMLDLPGSGIDEFCRAGAERFGWTAVAVTLGSEGSAIWTPEAFARVPGIPVVVADTVGAGDAFAAAFLHGLHAGWPPDQIANVANRLGALVASRPGGIPAWTLDELIPVRA